MNHVLEISNMSKNFGPTQALKSVDFNLNKGEVKGLLGANGAGKTTLIKIIAGAHQRTSGTMILRGNEVDFKNSNESMINGISVIHQELSLVPTLTVLENMFLGREETKNKFFIDKKNARKKYEEISEKFDFHIDADELVSNLSIAEQQMIEIMKTVSTNADIVIMDEPTTSLTENEKKGLFKMIDQLKKDGKSIIYITHVLNEVFELCDTATIMMNGNVVGDYNVEDLTKAKIANLMTDSNSNLIIEEFSNARYDNPPVLEVTNLGLGNDIANVTFNIFPGEVVGFAGLVGSKRTEIVNLIFGLDEKDHGEIILKGNLLDIKSPEDAIRAGIGLIPEDRQRLGLVLGQEVYKNATAIQLQKFTKNGFLDKAKEIEFSNLMVSELGIQLDNVQQKMSELSGGNQQKVVISKWIGQHLDILIYDEPTKGIDINAKEDVFKSIGDFTSMETGILFISSDLEEVIRVSDRIYIISEGTIIDEVKNENINVNDLMNLIFKVEEAYDEKK